jgi:anaerobic selenocysteine-containing dehydrogenase
VLLDLGARLGLPGMTNADGAPKFPGGYADYIVNHERSPGIGPLSGWRGERGDKSGVGAVNPDQLDRYIENGCFWHEELPLTAQFMKHGNRRYLDHAVKMGWLGHADPILHQLYNEDLQKFRNAARGHGSVQPPEAHRERIETYFDPLPIWYQPFLERDEGGEEFPVHALSQRPMHMYHSWGSQNAWLRQITSVNKLHVHRELAARHELADDDWVWIENPRGRVKAQVRLVTGVNPNVVWTWNAIGKRKGAWGLDKDSPEFAQGFLLNHIITETLLPEKGGPAYSNSDPVTGQAAWYDLRVRLRKCSAAEAGETAPMFEPLAQRFAGQRGPMQYGTDLQGADSGGNAELREFIGQRAANHSWIDGVGDGRDSRAKEDL